ncbi:MAG TPA: rhodanese-like domain-containing protein [Pyrinomonadaceae bacterium]
MRQVTLCALLLLFISAWSIGQMSNASAVASAVQSRVSGVVKKITARQLEGFISSGSPVTIIDVRLPKHYESSQTKIKGAIRITPSDLAWRLNEIPRHKQVVLYCACPDEATSLRLGERLKEGGYKDVSVLKGGWDAWVQNGGQQTQK